MDAFLISKNSNLDWNMSRYHFHEFYEINFVLKGDARFFVADRIYQAQPYSLLVFNPTDLHKSSSPPGALYERVVLYFAAESVEGLSSPQTNLLECFDNRSPDFSHCVQLTQEQATPLTPLFDKAIVNQKSEATYGGDLYRRIILAEILLNLNQIFRSQSAPLPLSSEPEMRRVLPMLQFIQEHLHEDLSLARLANAFYMSKHHLSHTFKAATGFTPNEYIIHRRIMKARELLKRRELSIQRVGESVGFNNNSHFIRTFKNLVGTSPKQYSLGSYPRPSGYTSAEQK